MTSTSSAPPEPDQPVRPRRPVRRRMNWLRALGVSVAAFLLWLVFYAPTLEHNAQAQPLGARRTVSLDTLGPIAALSRALLLSHVVSVSDGFIGRSGNLPGDAPPPPSAPPIALPHRLGSVAAPTSTTTTTTVPPDPRPTAANPLRVLMIGDSIGLDLGQSLQNDLANTGEVQPLLDGKIDTGLSRPDYFDWPVELEYKMSTFNPQVVVIMMGANDPQPFPGPPFLSYGTPQWNDAYGQRVNEFMHIATSNGARLIWVGLPPMQDPGRSAAMADLNGVAAGQARRVPGVAFLSSWNLLGGPKGTYQPFIAVNGQLENIRTPDGTHLTNQGAELLSQAVLADMHTQLHITLSP
jgi:hypothetical protein